MKHLLILGSGAREHAIAVQLSYSNERYRTDPSETYAINCLGTTNNPGLMDMCSRTGGTFCTGVITDPIAVVSMCTELGVSLVIIGPESPLESGTADALRAVGIAVVGPDKLPARIETSKTFAREFLLEHIPEACPEFHIVSDLEKAAQCINILKDSYVIKADGLAGGKGVLIANEHLFSDEEALAHCAKLLQGKDRQFVIEEKLEGEEFSLMTATDGKTCLHFPPLQDHKRAYDGDQGPNTGGMGSYTGPTGSLPFLTPQELRTARSYNERVVRELSYACGTPYRGILYGGFMATADGVKIIEYNARLGDPEALNLMKLITSDGIELFERVANGTLEGYRLEVDDAASVCLYVVPNAYPLGKGVGDEIEIDRLPPDISLFFGSVDLVGDKLLTAGSRSLALVACAPTITDARRKVLEALHGVRGNVRHRTDIASEEVLARRVAHMRCLRPPLRLAVLGSTNGTDMDAIIEGIENGSVQATIALVLSDRKNAPILDKATRLGIETRWIDATGSTRDEEVTRLCEQFGIELILLIGYMRILGRQFCERWQYRIMNIHPSLLPDFAGTKDTDTHTLAIERMHKTGNNLTGCTVHLVTADVDAGPILMQRSCRIIGADTPATLKRKVQALEGEALCACIEQSYQYRGDCSKLLNMPNPPG